MTDGSVGGKRKGAKPRPNEAEPEPAPKSRKYLCGKCGQPKAGHICTNPDGQPTAAAASTGPSAAAEDGGNPLLWDLDVGNLDLTALLGDARKPASPFMLNQYQLVQQHHSMTAALATLLRSPAAADARVDSALAGMSSGLRRKCRNQNMIRTVFSLVNLGSAVVRSI